MRELKFRAWLEYENRFADLIQIDSDGDWHSFCEEDGIYSEYFPTDKDIVEQYTGLKDKNGKEIYEGDIVRHSGVPFNKPKHFQGVVKWLETDASFRVFDNPLYMAMNTMQLEIIGNIHESPELLEKI